MAMCIAAGAFVGIGLSYLINLRKLRGIVGIVVGALVFIGLLRWSNVDGSILTTSFLAGMMAIAVVIALMSGRKDQEEVEK